MKFKFFFILIVSIATTQIVTAQYTNTFEATLIDENHTIIIEQKLNYHNTSGVPLDTLYFNDWNNAYSENKTDLAKRFREEFNKSLHLAKIKDRGYTRINSILNKTGDSIYWQHTNKGDILQVVLPETLDFNEHIELNFSYEVDLPLSLIHI